MAAGSTAAIAGQGWLQHESSHTEGLFLPVIHKCCGQKSFAHRIAG